MERCCFKFLERIESLLVCGGLVDSRLHTRLPENSRYWEKLDGRCEDDDEYVYNSLKGTTLEKFCGASSNVIHHIRTRALCLGMLVQYVLSCMRLYFGSFAIIMKHLTTELNGIDPSGSLSAVLATLVLMLIMMAFAITWLPCFGINSIHSSVSWVCVCTLYYMGLSALVEYMFVVQAKENFGDIHPILIALLCINIIVILINLCMAVYVVYLVKTKSSRSYLINRLNAFRLYAYYRLNGVGRRALQLEQPLESTENRIPCKDFESKNPSSRSSSFKLLRKDTWNSHDTNVSHLRSVFIPSTELEAIAGLIYEIPDYAWTSTIVGAILLISLVVFMVSTADHTYDFMATKIADFEIALHLMDEARNISPDIVHEPVYILLEQEKNFYSVLQNPLKQSIIAASYLGMLWSAAFFPSMILGAKRVALELRLGIADGPGMQHACREVQLKAYRAMYFIPSYLSCVLFGFLFAFICFFGVVLLITWPPFSQLVWKLNWLWLPAIVSLVLKYSLRFFLYNRFHQFTIPKNKPEQLEDGQHPGEMTSYTLVKPCLWAPFELGNMLTHIPASGMTALMRCVFVLLVAILGVLRLDISLLPTGAHIMDSPYVAFAALMLRCFQTNNPLTVVAADMFLATHKNELKRTKSFYKARNKLWLALMLHQYPWLQKYRIHWKPRQPLLKIDSRPSPDQEEKVLIRSISLCENEDTAISEN
mmetsp:Transcript_44373/g.71056  ORF Transcript_44373/g.71056 Transcript_44373/m.71056 type:complete len:707 (+) Transcript_44373:99-2219(+)